MRVGLACFIMEISSCKMLAKPEVQDNAWSIKINYIKRNKGMPRFLLNVAKPFNYILCVSPLVYI